MELEIQYLKPSDLKPYSKNARKHTERDVGAIIASIREFGFNDPVGIWGKQNIVVEGHGRLLAAKELGLEKIPCIRLDELTDEQRRAYTLAHNKTAENSSWDMDMLSMELNDIDIDMSGFGFEMPELDDGGYFGDERERTYNEYNLKDYDSRRVAGPYDLPVLKRCCVAPKTLLGFNYVLNTRAKPSGGVHFFLDDYQFERVWAQPYRYMEKLREYEAVCTPDFSLYMDMPMAMKIWNVYRSRLIGQLYQDAGLNVIPTLQWAGPETYSWAFDGIESGGTVCVSTVGVMREKEALEAFYEGFSVAMDKVRPKTVILYGVEIDVATSAEVIKIKPRSFNEREDVV